MSKVHSKKTPGEVRIIGGIWKKTPLQVTVALGLRPTPHRMRETLFNWLGQDLSGWHCADVFAGTGALGFEAASRGAKHVWMNEIHPEAFAMLMRNVNKLKATQITVSRTDGLQTLLGMPPQSLDLIFLDPPFANHNHIVALSVSQKIIKPSGWVYLECPTAWDKKILHASGWNLYRQAKVGVVHSHLLTPIA